MAMKWVSENELGNIINELNKKKWMIELVDTKGGTKMHKQFCSTYM